MKFSIMSCVYNESGYITYWLDQVYSHVDEIVLVEGTFAPHTKHYDEPHSKGMFKNNVRSNDGTIELIQNYPDPDKKIKLLCSDGDQIDCMNFGISKCTGNFIFVIDIDEFYTNIEELKTIVSNYRQYDAFTADFWEFYFDKNHYMMNPNKVLMCIKNFYGVRFTKSRTINTKNFYHIKPFCFHYSYLKSAERIRQKMIPYGNKGAEWYKNVYQIYQNTKSLDKVYQLNNNSVHLLFSNKHLIEYNEDHPEVLKNHPLFINDEDKLSILIPSYNRLECLKKAIEHIEKNTKVPYEIVIVDDNSPDKNVKRYLRKIESNIIKVFFNKEGLGFVKTLDRAIKNSTGNYIAVLNNDAYVQPNWDISAIMMLKDDITIGMVEFKLIKEDGTIQTCGWRRNNDKDHGFLHAGKDRYDPEAMIEENVLYAPLGVVRRSVFYDVGGLDCRFHMGWSDVSLGIEMNKCGYKVRYCPLSEVVHAIVEESRDHHYNEDTWLFRKKYFEWRRLMNGESGIIDGQDYDNTSKDMGSVDILIITNNRLKYSLKCFEHLRKNTQYKNVRYFVVDNASTDGTVEYLKKQDWIYDLKLNSENIPISQVTNGFWKKSKADFVGKIDNDTLVPKRWLIRLLEGYAQIPKCGVLSGLHFLPTDLDYQKSKHLIESYDSAAILRQKFVGGCCYILKREIIIINGYQQNKPMLYGWGSYQEFLHKSGLKNGYLYIPVWIEHMDDLRSKHFDNSDENLKRLKRIFALRKLDGSPENIVRWYERDAKVLLTQEL